MARKRFTVSALGLVAGLIGAAALLAPACSKRPVEAGDGGFLCHRDSRFSAACWAFTPLAVSIADSAKQRRSLRRIAARFAGAVAQQDRAANDSYAIQIRAVFSAEEFQKIGQFASRWAHIEHTAANCLRRLLEFDPKQATVMIYPRQPRWPHAADGAVDIT